MIGVTTRSVAVETMTIPEIVDKLSRNHYLIPTFQRDFVWQPINVIALWDSMYRSYPIGGIICWNTYEQLDTHRRIGGFSLEPDVPGVSVQGEYRYILDGQQRMTSMFIGYMGGSGLVEDEPFDFGLYFDPTASDAPGTDWREGVFLFAKDLNSRRELLRQRHQSPDLIIRVGDRSALDGERVRAYSVMSGYTPEVAERFTRLYRMLYQYRVPFIHSQGVSLSDVCDIFERINQTGRKLTTADIVIARTFRAGSQSFNLRRMFEEIGPDLSKRARHWRQMDHLALLQMIGVCMRIEHSRHAGRNPYGIDKDALLNLKPEAIQPRWGDIRKAIIETIEFVAGQGVFTRTLLPSSYLMLPICAYLYQRAEPQRERMRQWFWRTAFDHQSIDSERDVYLAIEDLIALSGAEKTPTLKPLRLSIRSFIRHYNHDSSFHHATLAFLSYLEPRDFRDGQVVTHSPDFTAAGNDATIHHIYPKSFLSRAKATSPNAHLDSLMNKSFLSRETNQQIGDRSPAQYFADYRDNPDFEAILASQLIPLAFAQKTSFERQDYREFLLARARLFAERLQQELSNVPITIVDQ